MTSDNCLPGLACPKCGQDSTLSIHVASMAVVTDGDAETYGEMDWNSDTYAKRSEGGYVAALGEFSPAHNTDDLPLGEE